MDANLILLSLGLALTAWVLARGLHRARRLHRPGEPAYAAVAADQSARAMGFLALLFALKVLPLLAPAMGLLRRDFLFPLLGPVAAGRWRLVAAPGAGTGPGARILLWILDRATGGRAGPVSLAVVLLSTLGLLPMLAWARCFLPERGARAAAILWVMTPAVALYGATSMDMIFAVPLMAAGALFAMALTREAAGARRPWLLPAGAAGLFLAMGFLFTFSAGVLAATWMATVLLVPRQIRRHALAVLITAGAACILALVLVMTLTGLDLVACLRMAMSLDAAEAPATLSLRYYLLTRLMGCMDLLILAGVALSPVWLRVLWRGWAADTPAGMEPPTTRETRNDAILLALGRGMALAICLFLALGTYKIGETGRILLFLLPLMILPAARSLLATGRASATGLWLFSLTALWHLGQTALMEWFLDTRW